MQRALNYIKPQRRWWPLPLLILMLAAVAWLLWWPGTWALILLVLCGMFLGCSLLLAVTLRPDA